MFIVMIVKHWKDIQLESVNAITPKATLTTPDTGSIGFLEVFETKEQAIEAYGDSVKLAEVRQVS